MMWIHFFLSFIWDWRLLTRIALPRLCSLKSLSFHIVWLSLGLWWCILFCCHSCAYHKFQFWTFRFLVWSVKVRDDRRWANDGSSCFMLSEVQVCRSLKGFMIIFHWLQLSVRCLVTAEIKTPRKHFLHPKTCAREKQLSNYKIGNA